MGEVVAQSYFGEVPGFPPGSHWETRKEASVDRVHRPTMAGICGTGSTGAESIVLNDGYEDDQDLGDEIRYTGHGGQTDGKQTADQTFEDPGNAALVNSELSGMPVRVIRGFKGEPKFSPRTGYRYDGLYRVADHWQERGISGFNMCFFTLIKIDSDEKAVFEERGRLPEGNHKPGRTTRTSTAVDRDSEVAKSVKRIHEHACQMCDIQLVGPRGPIADGAHIRGLGEPHNGPDIPSNILCLCPNHHRLFDSGAIYIDDNFRVFDFNGSPIGPLTRNKHHTVDLAFIRYHRESVLPPLPMA
jgi:putative restriction endonuclease